MADKKTIERDILEAFRANYPNFPSGQLVQDDEQEKGRPDFWIDDLGIEVTFYTYEQKCNQTPGLGASIFAAERIFEQIVRQAQEKFEQRQQTSLTVFVDFQAHTIPKRAEAEQLATSLAEVVERHMPQDDEHFVELWQYHLQKTALNGAVKYLSIHRARAAKALRWTRQSVSSSPEVSVPILEEIIAEKNANLSSYFRVCSRMWLIVADVAPIAMLTEMPDQVAHHQFHTGFERVFFFDLPHQRITQLTTRPVA